MWLPAFCVAVELVEAGRMGWGVGGQARRLHWLGVPNISISVAYLSAISIAQKI